MAFIVDYKLTGPGWAACSVSRDGESCEISASYLTDALGNLLLCAYGSISGFSLVAFGFDEEPGEYRWVVRQVGSNTISVEILSFHQLWGLLPDSEGKSLFSATCEPLEFAKAVLAAAEHVLSRHGVEGYLALWLNPFPAKQFDLLRETILARRV
jgi:hypothetical protein